MVADSEAPRNRYENQREKIIDEFSSQDTNAVLDFLDAFDPNIEVPRPPEGDSTKAITTCYNYARGITKLHDCLPCELTEATADEINQTMKGLFRGTHEDAQEGGYSQNYCRSIQSNAIKFYRYHDGEFVDPDEIFRYSKQSTTVDERDMFTEDEIEAMREVIENPRDRAIFELLLNTGQRVSAIQKLRVKDVRPDEGVLYLNADEGQHKNAQGKRPLLGAESACREWLRYHPTNEPDDYFITQRENYAGPNKDPGSQLHTTNIWRTVKKIADKANVTKPSNPHQFRHVFATICAEDYNMSADTIKHLLGHSDSSTTFEETYKHISDSAYIEKAEIAAGKREEKDEDNRLSPKICDCGQQLPANAQACHACGVVFSPKAKAAQDHIEDTSLEGMRQADSKEEADAVETFRDFLKNNPEKAVDMLSEEL